MKYKIVEGFSKHNSVEDISAEEDLENKVNVLLEEGWELQGGICSASDIQGEFCGEIGRTYSHLYFYQAMFLPTSLQVHNPE